MSTYDIAWLAARVATMTAWQIGDLIFYWLCVPLAVAAFCLTVRKVRNDGGRL